MDNNATAIQPTATPTHCHQRIFSLKANKENNIVTISPPTDNTG